jgi:TDG/mug DNA glycosylase family protein
MKRVDCAEGRGKAVEDLLAPNLRVLLVGINPSTCSGAAGLHFASPGNRLWETLHRSGFTDRRLLPDERSELLARGIGISNLVNKATARADEVNRDDLIAGGLRLREVVARFRPRYVAVLGIGDYRTAFDHRDAQLGRQPIEISGVPLWVLPNPSGLNAHYTVDNLAPLYHELLVAIESQAAT